jgi:predicted unusual protein kinase regulating ubiquinone biosynthesis (AarF/ABC1/UbiB family)
MVSGPGAARTWPVVERGDPKSWAGHQRGVRLHRSTIPLAAASIAQVHRARLLDGTEVVIKVQRPSVTRRVHQDLAVMAWLAPHLVGRIPIAALANPPALVELFAETIVEELDFRLEAENMLDIAVDLRRARSA